MLYYFLKKVFRILFALYNNNIIIIIIIGVGVWNTTQMCLMDFMTYNNLSHLLLKSYPIFFFLPALTPSLPHSLWPLTCGSCVNVLSPHCVGLPLIVSLCCVVATETLDRLQRLRRTHMRARHSNTHTHSQSHTRDLKPFVPPHFPRPTSSLFCVLQTHTCVFACLSVTLFTHTHFPLLADTSVTTTPLSLIAPCRLPFSILP